MSQQQQPPPPPYNSGPQSNPTLDLLAQLVGDSTLGAGTTEPQRNTLFIESFKTASYIAQCEDGGILPLNESTKLQLTLDEERSKMSTAATVEQLRAIKRDTAAPIRVNATKWPDGVVLQVITRFLPFTLKYRTLLGALPADNKLSVNVTLNSYRDLLVDMSHPFKSILVKEFTRDYLENAKYYTGLTIDPYPDAMADFKIAIGAASPYITTGANIVPFDINATVVENLWRQATGTDKFLFIGGAGMYNGAYDLTPFPFKEYVKHKIPLKRCTNGASMCVVEPAAGIYYITTLSLADHHFRILKNLIIYENSTGRTPYIQTGVKVIMSMVEDSEDLRLMMEYGIVKYPNRVDVYDRFNKQMAELQAVMSAWILTRTQTYHLEMVEIALHKAAIGDTSPFSDFAKAQYRNGVLGTQVAPDILYKDLSKA